MFIQGLTVRIGAMELSMVILDLLRFQAATRRQTTRDRIQRSLR
jgi:hypothetical protein